LLGGFDLASVALILSGGHPGGITQAAVASFGSAAAIFVLALAFITSAEDYSATPSDRLMYNPEANISADELENQRRYQAQDLYVLALIYNRRVLPTVTAGVILTLIGLVLLLLSKGLGWWLVATAVVVGSVALILLLDWRIDGRWWLFPRATPNRRQRRLRKDWARDPWLRTEPPRPHRLCREVLPAIIRDAEEHNKPSGSCED
jgi:hypothetical protein